MYQSPVEARSDLFLTAAVYLFAPAVVSTLLDALGVGLGRMVGTVVGLVVHVTTTVVVPISLIRYRREDLAAYGLGAGPPAGMGLGLLIAAPIAVAALVAGLVETESRRAGVPLLGGPDAMLTVLVRVVFWLGLAFLAVYVTVKARNAFGGHPQTVRQGVAEISRWLGIVVAVAALLLLAAGDIDLALVILPLGVAGAVLLAVRSLRGPSVTARTTLLTPVVVLALGAFGLSFEARALIEGAWVGALVGAIGLIIGALQEQRRSAQPALALAVGLALLTSVP